MTYPSDAGDMRVVSGISVNQYSPVAHTRDLISSFIQRVMEREEKRNKKKQKKGRNKKGYP